MMEGTSQLRKTIVSRCFALVNWKFKSIPEIYPETNLGMNRLVEDLVFETDAELELIQYYLFDCRDLDALNDLLSDKKTNLELITLWLDPELVCEV